MDIGAHSGDAHVSAVATSDAPSRRGEVLRSADLVIDPSAQLATWRGTELRLSGSEYRILRLLVRRGGVSVGYRDLYDAVRRPGLVCGVGEKGFHGAVRTHVKRIRKAFRRADPTFRLIRNHSGFGYRWEGEPAVGWTPTHAHHDGGLYRVLLRDVHHAEDDLSPGVVYENEAGERFYRPRATFDGTLPDGRRRFEPVGDEG